MMPFFANLFKYLTKGFIDSETGALGFCEALISNCCLLFCWQYLIIWCQACSAYTMNPFYFDCIWKLPSHELGICSTQDILYLMQLFPDCAPHSVAYILELFALRHCAGCQFYRAENRGQSWDSEGNHIKNVRIFPSDA